MRERVCRFGVPRTIISDNAKQFADDPFKSWCAEMNIQQKFASIAHPQANGQAEVTNRTLLHGLGTRLDKAKGDWVEPLPNVLWSYRTTPRTPTSETPYSLVYGSEAVIPAEIGLPSPRMVNFTEQSNSEELLLNLDALPERRELACVREAKYKEAMAKYNKVKINEFKPGDLVLRRNEASRAERIGKLQPNWEGPYKVVDATRVGSYRLSTLRGEPIPRRWQVSNLRRYYV